MAGAIGHHVGPERPPEKREIAGQVKHLVSHEFIRVTQIRVENSIFPDHQRVVQRTAKRQSVGPQLLNILLEGEGAGCRELVPEVILVP